MQGEQLKAAPMAAEPLCRGVPRQRLATHRRSGFTLVELLVVLLIVGMLAAILTPVVMQSLAKARNAAIKAEIDMLHMAIMNYKNEYGSFPPTSLDPTAPPNHLKRLFPRANPTTAFASLPTISSNNAVAYWLSGFTDLPTDPLGVVAGTKRIKLYDFDQARLNQATLEYHPSQKPGSPYLFIPASQYSLAPYLKSGMSLFGAHAQPPTPIGASPRYLPPSGNLNELVTALVPSVLSSSAYSQEFFNPDTFQIISAGRDEIFGTDDDLSNFWPGTRGEYLESLNK